MPRQARIDAPGALQQVIVRGIERRKLFADDADRTAFVDRLGQVLQESGTTCYAWTLRPDHVHLLLQTGKVPVAAVMRPLLTGYAVTCNRGTDGTATSSKTGTSPSSVSGLPTSLN